MSFVHNHVVTVFASFSNVMPVVISIMVVVIVIAIVANI